MQKRISKILSIMLVCVIVICAIPMNVKAETIADRAKDELSINEFFEYTLDSGTMKYYKITLNAQGKLIFDVSLNDEKLNPSYHKEITAYDEAGNLVTSYKTFWSTDSLSLDLKAGTYYIVLRNNSTTSGAGTFYLRFEEVESITLAITVDVKKGKTLKLGTVITPSKSATELTWKSSKASVATVSQKGVVTAKKKGKSTIKVYTKLGQIATVIINVTE